MQSPVAASMDPSLRWGDGGISSPRISGEDFTQVTSAPSGSGRRRCGRSGGRQAPRAPPISGPATPSPPVTIAPECRPRRPPTISPCAIAALAIIAAVRSAINLVIRGEVPLLILSLAIIAPSIIIGTVAIVIAVAAIIVAVAAIIVVAACPAKVAAHCVETRLDRLRFATAQSVAPHPRRILANAVELRLGALRLASREAAIANDEIATLLQILDRS